MNALYISWEVMTKVLEEDKATHSSILAWRIPWTEKPGRLQSIGLHRVGQDWSDLLWHVVQLLSYVLLFVTSGTAAQQAPLSFTISWNLLKLRSIESVMPSNHLVLCYPLLLLLQSLPASGSFTMSWLFASGDQR